jgi:DNA sulfur modification protein DndD
VSGAITLLGWEAHNLRCPDHKIELSPSRDAKPYRVTLIQMPNGTGKTMTLSMLRATLSGSAERWSDDTIREFQKKGSSSESGKFIVFLSLDKKRITLDLNLDFENGVASYRTTFGSGVQKGFRPPPELRRFLNKEFVELFVFDGELANRLLDNQETRAREAIDQLFQLPLLDQVHSALQSNWDEHAKTVSSKQEKGLRQRKNRLSALTKRPEEIARRRKHLKIQIPRLTKALDSLNRKYDDELGTDGRTADELLRSRRQPL